MFTIKVKVTEVNSEPCERTNVDIGSTTPPLSNITQNLVDLSTTNNVVDLGPPTPTCTETNNTHETTKGNYLFISYALPICILYSQISI